MFESSLFPTRSILGLTERLRPREMGHCPPEITDL
jgi:hypothetical protein